MITDFISSDPKLKARILKMVNSPLYGFPGRISFVKHAMVILGLNAVKGLFIGFSVFEVMKKTWLDFGNTLLYQQFMQELFLTYRKFFYLMKS